MPVAGLVVVVLAAVVVVVALLSTGGYVLAFWGFRLTRHSGGTLHVARGLLSTRATTIEERRLRGVELSEPLLLRWAGGARCVAIATGLRVGRGAERGGSLLFPPGPRSEARRVAAEVLRTGDPLTAPLTRARAARHPPALHPRARRRRRDRRGRDRPRGRRPLAHLGLGGLGRDRSRRPRPSPRTAPAASATP